MPDSVEVALARLPELDDVGGVLGLPADAMHHSGLILTDNEMTYDDWSAIGHRIAMFNRWSKFALADWILFGDRIFGEDAVEQAVESTASERYDVAQRITGLKVATLMNYVSIGRRIPPLIRRIELTLSEHEPVAGLERPDQIYWLDQCVRNSWDRDELREAIRNGRGDDGTPHGPDGPPSRIMDPSPRNLSDRVEHAARLCFERAQPTVNGGVIIPAEPWAQLRAALGETED